MNKRVLAVLTVALLTLSASIAGAQSRGTVLLLPREGSINPNYMIEKEANVMIALLRQAGYNVVVATVTGHSIEGTKLTLPADLKIRDVHLKDYVGVLMPCMAAGGAGSWHATQDQIDIVRAATSRGMLIGAQASSIIILAEAGLLDGKRYTYYQDGSLLPKPFQGGIYSGKDVVRDGNLITSGTCPYVLLEYGTGYIDGTTELTEEFIVGLSQ